MSSSDIRRDAMLLFPPSPDGVPAEAFSSPLTRSLSTPYTPLVNPYDLASPSESKRVRVSRCERARVGPAACLFFILLHSTR